MEIRSDIDAESPSTPQSVWVALVCIGVFLLLQATYLKLYHQMASDWSASIEPLALVIFGYAPQWCVMLGIVALLFGPRRMLWVLGLDRAFLQGLSIPLLCTAILLLGFAVTAKFAPPSPLIPTILDYSLMPGFSEEFLFRGFLFGLLFRFARWGFLPAALLGAVFFGAGHLYQGKALTDAAEIFAITAFGGIWFAWLYAEWDHNLWVPIGFHVLMNLYWSLFEISHTALGTVAANVLRVVVILFSIALTLRHAFRRGGRVVSGRAWLWGGPVIRKAT